MDLELKLEKGDEFLTDGSDDSSDVITDDLDDVELLKECSREDLFMLIREDPEYYCKLIKQNKLGDALSIKIDRNSDGGGLNIKFRIYPEDRWTEVGYWEDATDKEVYADFKTQIDNLLSKSRKGKDRSHLQCQLEGNNDPMSMDYGNDISGFNKKTPFKTPLEVQLEGMLKNDNRRNPPENLKDNIITQEKQIENQPINYLNQFVAGLIDKIIREIPQLIVIEDEQNYYSLITCLNERFGEKDIPTAHLESHKQLIEKLRSLAYLQRMYSILSPHQSHPEIYDYLVDFHRDAMKINPGVYRKIRKDALVKLLDEDDQKILSEYCLDVQEVWLNYLNNQDE